MTGTPVRGTPTRGGQARTSLARFGERERDRGAVMPGTFRAAVAAEMGQAFSPPYQVPIVVAVNGLLMAGAWFLLPRGWLFTLQSALAFPVVLSSWMYADVPATNVLAPDRIRVLAALGDRTMISRLLLAKTAVLWVFVAPLCAVLALVVGLEHHARCSSAPRSSRSASSPSPACQSRRWSASAGPTTRCSCITAGTTASRCAG